MFGLGKRGASAKWVDGEYAAEHALVERHVKTVLGRQQRYYGELPLKESEAGEEILGLPAEALCRVVLAAQERIDDSDSAYQRLRDKLGYVNTSSPVYQSRMALFSMQNAVLRRKLPFDEAAIALLLERMDGALDAQLSFYTFPASGVVKAFKDFADRGGKIDAMESIAKRIIGKTAEHHNRDVRKLADRLVDILGIAPELPIRPGEAWGDAAIGHIERRPEKTRAAWAALLAHCATASAGKPAKKWSATAESLLEKLPKGEFADALASWFELIDRPRTQPIAEWPQWAPDPNLLIDEVNADVLKGLLWTAGISGENALADTVGRVALSAYRKVPGVGPRATKVGNACVWALGRIPGESALAALAILKVRVKFRPAQKGIAKALEEAAERAGMTPAELEELGVPAYGLEEGGVRREMLGDYVAELAVVNAKKVALTFVNASGKALKSVPKAVRDEHGDELKELRQSAKDIQKMLSAQRDRLDNLFLAEREWPYADWRERYIDHPLVGTLGRKLVWAFRTENGDRAGIWANGEIVGADDAVLEDVGQQTTVRLWHPVHAGVDTVVAWRSWLERHEVTQPFKQAHREVYLLTEAEQRTGVYSNRYASHIVKQHQFNALCAARGWRHSLRLLVDDEYEPPTKELPQHRLRAEFWVEGIGEDYGTDTTESGSYLYLATDQVRFYRDDAAANSAHAGGGGYRNYGTQTDANEPLPLSDIDPLVLSEVFRDVDLFVGVASVGNDPTWSDGGPDGRFIDYWTSYSFGELSESAETRKALLETLIPRLKIRERCEIDDRFLRVRGDLRTYRIHLGSGNVLMEPNDQYLCIVAAQGKAKGTDAVFLPFEGDGRLAVILSKAFLLAEDKKIKDSTILSQIRR